MNGSRARAVLTLALVFIAGAAAGIAGDRLEMIPRAAAATEAEGAAETADSQTVIEQFADELGLSSGQRMEIDLLLDYYAASLNELRRAVRPQYRALMDSVRVEIEDVLDDGQRGEYRALIDERYGAGSEPSATEPSDSNE